MANNGLFKLGVSTDNKSILDPVVFTPIPVVAPEPIHVSVAAPAKSPIASEDNYCDSAWRKRMMNR